MTNVIPCPSIVQYPTQTCKQGSKSFIYEHVDTSIITEASTATAFTAATLATLGTIPSTSTISTSTATTDTSDLNRSSDGRDRNHSNSVDDDYQSSDNGNNFAIIATNATHPNPPPRNRDPHAIDAFLLDDHSHAFHSLTYPYTNAPPTTTTTTTTTNTNANANANANTSTDQQLQKHVESASQTTKATDVHGRVNIAESLVDLLYTWLSAAPLTSHVQPLPSFSMMEAVQLSVLTNSLAMILMASQHSMSPTSIDSYGSNLVLSLHRLANDFGSWNGSLEVQEVILGNVMRSVRCIRPHVPHASEPLLDSLRIILQSPISNDIRIATAMVFTEFLDNPERGQQRHAVAKIEDDSSILISILSVAAMVSGPTQQAAVLHCFDRIVTRSSQLRQKMAKRRCAILAIAKLLEDPRPPMRKKALQVLSRILNDMVAAMILLTSTTENLELIVECLMFRLEDEADPKILSLTIATLCDAFMIDTGVNLPFVNKLIALYQASDGKVARAAAKAFCRIVELPCDQTRIYLHVVHLLGHRNRKIRMHALRCMETVSSYSQISFFFLTETDALDRVLHIFQHRHALYKLRALNILKTWSLNPANHDLLTKTSVFLDAVVGSLLQSPTHPIIQMYVIRIISAILPMSSESVPSLWRAYPKLLPWLVLESNRHDTDVAIQQHLSTLVIQLSEVLLQAVYE